MLARISSAVLTQWNGLQPCLLGRRPVRWWINTTMSELIQLRELPVPSRQELAALRRIRRQRVVLAVPLLGFFPGMWLAGRFGMSDETALWVWMGILAVCAAPMSLARCPRCGLRFHFSSGWHNPVSRACVNCDFGREVP
jgi:hypothetical protein